jgi:hypothetical protein
VKVPVPIYRFTITLKPRADHQFTEVRTAEAMSYREQDEFLCFDDTKVTVYQVRRDLVDEISCDGKPISTQEVEDPMIGQVSQHG